MVRSMGANLKRLPVSGRRVAAIVVAVGCHVGLLMLLLRPASNVMNAAAVVEERVTLLKLRLISTPLSPSPSSKSLPPQQAGHQSALANEPLRSRPVIARPESSSPKAPAEAPTRSVVPTVSPSSGASDRPVVASTSTGDGGFRERLLNAQRSQSVRGVPGSDVPVVPGIPLTDPMNQGVGAVMRSTQRLFGITDRHCIDVEVWQSLGPGELSARYLSPADVRRESDKYNCNRPLGLSF